MEKKKALLFPYDISLLHMAVNRKNIKEYDITNIASIKSWGYCGKDAGANLNINTGIKVSDDFNRELAEVETVIFADTNIPLEYDLICRYSEQIRGADKEILDIRRKTKKITTPNDSLDYDEIPQIRDVNKPVVLIVGTGVNTGKFDTQFYAREAFLNAGYKVSQIGSKSYCELWGFHSFPDFMTGTLNGAEKIIKFNQYVNYIVNSEDPDVVIIGVPGGIVPISSKMFDDFGLMNYMVSNAIKPDYVILNTGFVDYNKQYIETMVNALKHKFDYDVDSVFLSNFLINWEATDSLDKLVYVTLPVNVIDKESKECGCYSLHNRESIKKFKKNMISTLLGYSDFDAI